jgi:hypothetical protein
MNTNKQMTLFRLTCIALIVAFGMLMPACGGGGSDGGGGTTNPLTASFTPENPNPAADTIGMAGQTAGANVAVEIQVTGIDDFFGAGFRVTYDADTVTFAGFDAVGSLLEDHAGNTEIDARELDPGNLGTILVTATIQDAAQPAGIDVVGTRKLLTLNFQATTTIAAPGNMIEFGDPRDVQICAVQGGACNEVSGALAWPGGTIRASR